MKMHFGFSLYGLTIFILPMLINLIYFIFPPKDNYDGFHSNNNIKALENIEQISRILFAVALCILVSDKPMSFFSPFIIVGVLFLILYYIVWIRYFVYGRDVKMLENKFFGIPVPLSVFPLVYFLFCCLWLNNYVAFVLMLVFGYTHIYTSYKKLHK